jgi:hypothetical protein
VGESEFEKRLLPYFGDPLEHVGAWEAIFDQLEHLEMLQLTEVQTMDEMARKAAKREEPFSIDNDDRAIFKTNSLSPYLREERDVQQTLGGKGP